MPTSCFTGVKSIANTPPEVNHGFRLDLTSDPIQIGKVKVSLLNLKTYLPTCIC